MKEGGEEEGGWECRREKGREEDESEGERERERGREGDGIRTFVDGVFAPFFLRGRVLLFVVDQQCHGIS